MLIFVGTLTACGSGSGERRDESTSTYDGGFRKSLVGDRHGGDGVYLSWLRELSSEAGSPVARPGGNRPILATVLLPGGEADSG